MPMFQNALKEPPLEVEEERAALRAWQGRGDRAALGLLLRSHARQVWAHARKWAKNPTDLDDLMAEGMMGLIDAASRFDLERDVRFNTYAVWFIRNRVAAAQATVSSIVDVPTRVFIDARSGKLDPAANAEAMAAIEPMVGVDDASEVGTAVICPDKTPEEFVAEQSAHDAVRRLLDEALEKLEPMEQAVIRRRLDGEDVAGDGPDILVKVTCQRLRAIERRAIVRLRQILQRSGFSLAMLEH